MPFSRIQTYVLLYVREVSAHKLRGACIALYLAMLYATWSYQLGPAVEELQSARHDFENRLVHLGSNDNVRAQLRDVQDEVRTLRTELRKTYDPSDRISQVNRSYSYIESMAASAGLRIRLFETESQGSIEAIGKGFSKVALEGRFPDVAKFAERLSVEPSPLRLEAFVASVTEEMPETISLSLIFSDVVGTPHESRGCDVNF